MGAFGAARPRPLAVLFAARRPRAAAVRVSERSEEAAAVVKCISVSCCDRENFAVNGNLLCNFLILQLFLILQGFPSSTVTASPRQELPQRLPCRVAARTPSVRSLPSFQPSWTHASAIASAWLRLLCSGMRMHDLTPDYSDGALTSTLAHNLTTIALGPLGVIGAIILFFFLQSFIVFMRHQ